MPKCKNDSSRSYKGTEPSPKGRGYCAHAMEDGDKLKGKDGNMWIVKETNKGIKRWVKDNTNSKKTIKKTTKKTSKKVSKIKKGGKKDMITALDLYDVVCVSPDKLKNIMEEHKITRRILHKVVPELESIKKVFITPLPLSNGGVFWTDYAWDYIKEYYKYDDYDNYIYITVYLDDTGKEMTGTPIPIYFSAPFTKEEKKKLTDVLWKHLSGYVEWDGKDYNRINVHYKKGPWHKPTKFTDNDFANRLEIGFIINDKKIDLLENGLDSCQFLVDLIEYAKKYSNDVQEGYGQNDVNLTAYGTKNSKKICDKLNKLVKQNKISNMYCEFNP